MKKEKKRGASCLYVTHYLKGGRDKKAAFVFVLSACPVTILNTLKYLILFVLDCLTDAGADLIERFWSLKLSGHL